MTILYVLLAIIMLLVMVLVHEFGHYVVGRMLNFKINEFSVGFGKAIFSKKNKRGELISLRIFPLGGYCAFAGEDDEDCNKEDSFNNQKAWKRILVYLAGITFNFAFAVLTSAILLCSIGYDIPQVTQVDLDTTKIETSVEDGTFIQDSEVYGYDKDNGFKEGDIIISIEGKKIDFAYGKTYDTLVSEQFSEYKTYLQQEKLNSELSGGVFDERQAFIDFMSENSYSAIVKRDGEYEEVAIGFCQVAFNVNIKDDKGDYVFEEDGKTPKTQVAYVYYGPAYGVKAYVHTFGEAIERAVPFSFGLAWTVLKSLWQMITFQLPISSVGGPITTIATIAQVTQSNFANLLILIPLISANLAIFNLLPIPALDGAHVVFTTIEAIRKKPIKREVENMIHTIGLFVLLGFVVLVDILHFLL